MKSPPPVSLSTVNFLSFFFLFEFYHFHICCYCCSLFINTFFCPFYFFIAIFYFYFFNYELILFILSRTDGLEWGKMGFTTVETVLLFLSLTLSAGLRTCWLYLQQRSSTPHTHQKRSALVWFTFFFKGHINLRELFNVNALHWRTWCIQ